MFLECSIRQYTSCVHPLLGVLVCGYIPESSCVTWKKNKIPSNFPPKMQRLLFPSVPTCHNCHLSLQAWASDPTEPCCFASYLSFFTELCAYDISFCSELHKNLFGYLKLSLALNDNEPDGMLYNH